nr:reverse transcriptase domain-containing protein [Tanacetum cinerariifolium]
MFSVCLCARFQEAPKTSHLEAGKRIFRYIKGTTHLGLWHPKGTLIENILYADSDHVRDYVVRKSTSGVCTCMGCCLTSWFSKKQTALAVSTIKTEYVSARKACQQALWMNLFPPLDNLELTIRRRSRADPTLLNDFEMVAEGNGDLLVPDLRTMEELCQPSLNGRGSIKVNGVTDDTLRLYLFPHSLTHHATAWFDRLPRNSINTFEKMAKMFFEKYFPPSMVTKLKNEITNFRQRPDESLFEAWERYKLSIDRCPNHNMFLVTQIETFYNGLTLRHRDTINAAAGGTVMKRCPKECYDLIENMTAHHNNWNTLAQRSESSSSIASSSDTKIATLKVEMEEINKNLMRVLQVNQQVKAVTPNCETCSGPHSFTNCPATVGQTQNFMKMNTASSSGSGTLPGNTITNLKKELKGITTHSGTAYQGPTIPTTSSSLPSVVERETEVRKDTVPPTNNGSTKDVQPLVVQIETPILNSKPVVAPIIEPVVAPVSAPKPNQKPLITYPSRLHDQKLRDKANDQREIFFQIFKDLNFNISFVDALILMPKFGPTIKTLLTNKDKLSELARTPLNEHCSTVLLKKLPEKLGDPDKSFLKTGRALIDVFEGELTLRVGKEAITFNLDQTLRYSANYNDMTANRIDVIDMACEEYSQEVLGFSDMIASGNPTPYYDPIVSTSSPTLTLFGDSDFLLEEVNAFLALEDDPTSPEVDHSYFDPQGDILFLETFMNDDPSLPPLNQGNYLPQVRKELKICEAKTDKSLIDKPPEVELKELPPISNTHFWKSHKQAITWKLSDIKGIDPEFCTHKILMKDDFEPVVQHQRRVNPKIHDVIKMEVLKLLDARLIYPISDNPWVSLVHCVPKKGGFTVVENEENELIPIRLVTGWRARIEYRKFNEATRNNHFPLPFMDQMLERLAGNEYYCFLDGAVLGQRQEKHFRPIHYASKTMTKAESNYTTTEKKLLAVVYVFEKFRSYLIMNKSIMYTDHSALKYLFAKKDSKARLLRWVLLLQEFTFKVIGIKGAENLATDHISRLENPHQNVLDPKEINESFPLETLNMISFRCNSINYLSKWVEAKALPTNDARVVCKFLKKLFARFGTPRAIISDRGTHFCNDQFAKVMLKYGVTHRLATAYHLQTSGQVEVSNYGLKRILERTVGENRASWNSRILKTCAKDFVLQSSLPQLQLGIMYLNLID